MTAIDNEAIRSIGSTLDAMSVDPTNRPAGGSVLAAFGESGNPQRTNERTAKIVFPARIDANGTYHESTVVHAVIERPVWADELRGAERRASATDETDGAGMASAAPARGSALASMDEVVAARAARRAAGGTGHAHAEAEAVVESASASLAEAVRSVANGSVDAAATGEVASEAVVPTVQAVAVPDVPASTRQGTLWVGPEQASATAAASAAAVESAAATRTLNAVSLSAARAGAVLSVGGSVDEGDAGEPQ